MKSGTHGDVGLLLRLVRGDRRVLHAALGARPDAMAGLAAAALAGGLAIPLLRSLGHLPPGVELPPADIEALHARAARLARRREALHEALGDLCGRFMAAGQPFLLLKGPYLAERYYGDPAGRDFVDLDVLVPSAARQTASRLLEDAGFSRQSRVLGNERLTSRFVHAFDYVRGDAAVDLHWCLSRHPSLRLDEHRVWAVRRRWTFDHHDLAVLSDEHDLVFAVLSLMRDFERGRPKAKNIIDVIQMAAAADAERDWEAVFAGSHHDGTFGPLVNVLGLCLDTAGAHDLAPRLSGALQCHAARRVVAREGTGSLAFTPLAGGLGNKWWSARAYDTTPARWLGWWAVSLPFRMAVHRRVAPAAPARQGR